MKKMKDMLKIGTHDSATGEKGKGFLSWLVTIFAKTQSKTIKEQYEAGCRMFDIRCKLTKGKWYCAHGLWHTQRTLEDIICELALLEDRCQVLMTYEGGESHNEEMLDMAIKLRQRFKHIIWGPISVKYGKDSSGLKVKYSIIKEGQKGFENNVQGFLPLDGRSWHTLLPIPWLWKKIYGQTKEFREDVFTFVDFL